MDNDKNWRTDRDDDLFPTCNEDRDGQTHTDEYGVTYTCTLVEGLGWVWQNQSDREPPA